MNIPKERYLVMVYHGYDGWSIQGSSDELTAAVALAVDESYGSPCMIVSQVEWKAVEQAEATQGEI